MTNEQKDALQKVVNYLWNDERKHFEESEFAGDNVAGHIFTYVDKLRAYLEREGVEVFPEPEWHKKYMRETDTLPRLPRPSASLVSH